MSDGISVILLSGSPCTDFSSRLFPGFPSRCRHSMPPLGTALDERFKNKTVHKPRVPLSQINSAMPPSSANAWLQWFPVDAVHAALNTAVIADAISWVFCYLVGGSARRTC